MTYRRKCLLDGGLIVESAQKFQGQCQTRHFMPQHLRQPGILYEARTLFASLDEAQAPALWEAELANVIWMATRHKLLTNQDATGRLFLAETLGIHSVPNRSLWQGALMRSHESGIAVYGTLFVELAARERLPSATFDPALLKAFPRVAARPAELIARRAN